MSRILSTGGVCLSACWDTILPGKQTPPPPARQTPLASQTPPLARQAHPQQGSPPRQGDPPWEGDPPCAVHAGRYGQQAGGMILLECNLVNISFETVKHLLFEVCASFMFRKCMGESLAIRIFYEIIYLIFFSLAVYSLYLRSFLYLDINARKYLVLGRWIFLLKSVRTLFESFVCTCHIVKIHISIWARMSVMNIKN